MRRLYTFLIFMGVFSLAYQIGSMSPVNQEDAQSFLDEFEEIIGDIDAIGIFVHNTTIALPMFVPGFGVGLGIFSAWSTGYAFAAIATLMPQIADFPALGILYLTPFGLMELTAYSMATSRSYILIALAYKKRPIRPHLKATGMEVGMATGLLLAAAYVEFYIIQMTVSETPAS